MSVHPVPSLRCWNGMVPRCCRCHSTFFVSADKNHPVQLIAPCFIVQTYSFMPSSPFKAFLFAAWQRVGSVQCPRAVGFCSLAAQPRPLLNLLALRSVSAWCCWVTFPSRTRVCRSGYRIGETRLCSEFEWRPAVFSKLIYPVQISYIYLFVWGLAYLYTLFDQLVFFAQNIFLR